LYAFDEVNQKGTGVAETWRPTEGHLSYMDDPTYLDRRFGLQPLPDVLLNQGAIGVARLVVMPSFSAESVCTLSYFTDEVLIEVARAQESLWGSLNVADWVAPLAQSYRRPIGSLPAPLNRWQSLKQSARAAPTVTMAIIDGRESVTLDGVSYRHRVVDATDEFYAEWSNPTDRASNHSEQIRLLQAYKTALAMHGDWDRCVGP
jgi:hypothetical protein